MKIGTPLASNATKVLMLGGGELGKEVIIELQRLGVETIVCDRYEGAPAMQVAEIAHDWMRLCQHKAGLRLFDHRDSAAGVLCQIVRIAAAIFPFGAGIDQNHLER